jgi:leucyl aminopeptidase
LRISTESERAEAVGVLVFSGETVPDFLPEELKEPVRSAAERTGYVGRKGERLDVLIPRGTTRMVRLCGLGEGGKASEEHFREGAAVLARDAAGAGATAQALFYPGAGTPDRDRAVAEGALLGLYRFEKYRKPAPEDKFRRPEEMAFPGADPRALAAARITAESQAYARDLSNEPGCVLNPRTLSEEARRLARELDLTIRVFEPEQVEAMGMGALSAVGRGSAERPRLIHLTWKPKNSLAKVALVGKGLTFDSGGLCIKPSEHMRTMKGDKMGACVVLAAIRAAALLELPLEIHALAGLAENMPDGSSFRPDDILTALNGKTIEVNDTDAEGRLTLADVLAYASALKPDRILDLATLTGSVAVALGDNTAGLFTEDEALAGALMAASGASGERLWRLPMDDERLKKQLESPVADLVNCGSRYGGASTAALFLKEFVDPSIPWAHLDIAAVDFVKETFGYRQKGATAFGVRLLVRWLEEVARKGV